MSFQVTKKQMRLTYEEYRSMANIFVHCLRKKEAEETQVTKSGLLNWYCEEIEKDVESQDEMVERRQIAEKVIDRLAFTDNILIPLTRTGLTSGKKGEVDDATTTGDDPVLVVHPNYVIED